MEDRVPARLDTPEGGKFQRGAYAQALHPTDQPLAAAHRRKGGQRLHPDGMGPGRIARGPELGQIRPHPERAPPTAKLHARDGGIENRQVQRLAKGIAQRGIDGVVGPGPVHFQVQHIVLARDVEPSCRMIFWSGASFGEPPSVLIAALQGRIGQGFRHQRTGRVHALDQAQKLNENARRQRARTDRGDEPVQTHGRFDQAIGLRGEWMARITQANDRTRRQGQSSTRRIARVDPVKIEHHDRAVNRPGPFGERGDVKIVIAVIHTEP
ncbi:hypothetical protein MBENS4_1312 [Novosphingobium sp. MBES04]|nr:hypothetical protein MBENS4_1312 [Novosphingobium sp. MBES04]